jgi:hypothetical protein
VALLKVSGGFATRSFGGDRHRFKSHEASPRPPSAEPAASDRIDWSEMRILWSILALCLCVAAEPRMQGSKEPVWVAQAPPFATIALLGGFPDLRSSWPSAGSGMTDVRVADWSPLRLGPGRYLRLTQVGDQNVSARLFLWWFGNAGPSEPPADSGRRCTVPNEGPRACVQSVALESRDWRALMQTLLAAPPCEVSRPTDAFELRLQVFSERRFRELDVCGAVAKELGELFASLVAPVYRRGL